MKTSHLKIRIRHIRFVIKFLLLKPFEFIYGTISLMWLLHKKSVELHKSAQVGNFESFESKREDLHRLSYVIDLSMLKIFHVLRLMFIVALFYFVYFYIWGQVKKTDIYVDVITQGLIIGKINELNNGNANRLKARDKIEISVSGINPNSALRGKFVNSQVVSSPSLEIGFLMPSNAMVSLTSPDTGQSIVGIYPLDKLSFDYEIFGQRFRQFLPGQSPLDTAEVISMLPTEITPEQTLMITLKGQVDFEMKPLVLNEIYFNTLAERKGQVNSYLVSGVIHLLDTKDDSIKLYRENYLSINPTRKIKVYISKVAEGFHVQFTASVSKLEVGSVYETDVRDWMPLIIKTNYDKYPYLWLIIPVIIPVLLSFYKIRSS